ncbi:MAG: superoxide dismutase family protein [Ottowia sp.]|nr:superoxide dismutase family protein [Ottowia sp.]
MSTHSTRSLRLSTCLLFVTALYCGSLYATPSIANGNTYTVRLFQATTQNIGATVGTVTLTQTPYGTLFTPNLSGLKPGLHGFHIHAQASCEPGMQDGKLVAALSAGGHFDPENTGKHLGPYALGHLGDLPALYVDDQGNANYPVLAPRIASPQIVRGHALVIHEGADNHSDHPKPLGGGGLRMQCGVI